MQAIQVVNYAILEMGPRASLIFLPLRVKKLAIVFHVWNNKLQDINSWSKNFSLHPLVYFYLNFHVDRNLVIFTHREKLNKNLSLDFGFPIS